MEAVLPPASLQEIYKRSVNLPTLFLAHSKHFQIPIPYLQSSSRKKSKPKFLFHTMHYQTILVALFSTTALANGPYVHSFYNADCTGPDAGDQVSINGLACTKVDSKYDAVSINFGTGYSGMHRFSVYSDDSCTVYAGKDITSRPADGTPAVCLSQSAHGAKWGSVQKKEH